MSGFLSTTVIPTDMDKGWTKHGQRMDTNRHEPTQKDTNGCKWTQFNTRNRIKRKRTATDIMSWQAGISIDDQKPFKKPVK